MKPLMIFVLVFCAFRACSADDAATALRSFKDAFRDSMVRKVRTTPKGARIAILFARGQSVEGSYRGYAPYDGSVWIKQDGRWLQDAYDVGVIQDIRVIVRRSV